MQALELTVGAVDADAVHGVDDEFRIVQIPREALGSQRITLGTVLRITVCADGDRSTKAHAELLLAQERLAASLAVPLDPTALSGHTDVLVLVDRTHTALTFRWPQWARLAAVARGAAPRAVLDSTFVAGEEQEAHWQACAPRLHSLDTVVNGQQMAGSHAVGRGETELRLTGLDAGATYALRMRFRTAAGVFETNEVVTSTPAWEDMACLRVRLVGGSDTERAETRAGLEGLGAAVFDSRQFGTADGNRGHEMVGSATHIVCLDNAMPSDQAVACKATNVPVLRREWVTACVAAGKMQSVSRFYANS